MQNKLVLFDIDWTLVRGRIPAHHESFTYGFRKVYNVSASRDDVAPYEGKVDKQIIFEVLGKKGLKRNQVEKYLNEMFRVMIDYAEKNMKRDDIVVLPAVEGFLKILKEHTYTLGVMTGNVEGIAKLKLTKAKLMDFFDIGAYGNETERRVELIDIARRRALDKLGLEFTNENIYLVGDSVRDIQCGKEDKIRTIGVATGDYTKEELLNVGANLVLSSLEEYEKAVEFIRGEP